MMYRCALELVGGVGARYGTTAGVLFVRARWPVRGACASVPWVTLAASQWRIKRLVGLSGEGASGSTMRMT